MTMQMQTMASNVSISPKTLSDLARELRQTLRDFEKHRQKLLASLHLPPDYPFLPQKEAYGNA